VKKKYDDESYISKIPRSTNLKPSTLTATKGAMPRKMAALIVNEIVNNPDIWTSRKRMTAMTSWEKRKNRGTAVLLRTHLLLKGMSTSRKAEINQ
jgi:hypothetical protein